MQMMIESGFSLEMFVTENAFTERLIVSIMLFTLQLQRLYQLRNTTHLNVSRQMYLAQ